MDWIVVLESNRIGPQAMSIDMVRRLMESMAERNPTTLYSPDRYALQVVVPGSTPDSALVAALESWRRAQQELELSGWELARAEVISQAEFEEDTVRRYHQIQAASDDGQEHVDEVLLRQVFHDPVTGLANRELFLDHLHHQLLRTERLGSDLALLFFEVDRTETLAGCTEEELRDLAATVVAGRLVRAGRDRDAVGRIGENRFAVLLHDVTEPTASAIGSRLLEVLQQPVVWAEQQVALTVRLGVVTASVGDTVNVLLERAETELARAPLTRRTTSRLSRRARRERSAEREAAGAAMTAAHESDTLEEEVHGVLGEVGTHVDWPLGHLQVVSAELGRRLMPTRLWNADVPQHLQDFQVVVETTSSPPDTGLPGLVLAQRQPLWVSYAEADDELPGADAAVRAGFTSGVGLPVLANGEVVGVLELFLPQSAAHDESLVQVLAELGTELGRWWSNR